MMRQNAPQRRGMTGVFPKWQPIYAERGIATFPVGGEKKPCIRGWQKVGLKGSEQLAAKFCNADAFGYVTGRRSRITVLDIDTTDERISEDAIRRHGQAAIVTRTASGKFHLLYRYNGERRRIRPWGDLPIDLLGDNGYALAAPSKLETGSYEIIHGHIDDLDRLTPMVGLDAVAPVPAKFTRMRAGDGRNRALWERCMRVGAGCGLDRMMEIAQEANQSFKEPLMDAEVAKIATSAWRHDVAGLNFFIRPRIMLDHDTFDTIGRSDPDALLLLLRLERYHGGNDRFILAKPMAASMGWTIPRWKAARSNLAVAGIIRCARPGGRGPNDPPIYTWGTKDL
jgi:Bifunctional DNA primase/polymerase, N-terminal/Primase C terminal 1 (PriCT-1)